MLNNKQLTLKCYAKKEEAQWVAVCIDLSLAAQADSSKEAIEKLESMMLTYVNDALNQHKEYAGQLLSRKAPLAQRLFYYQALSFYFLRKIFCKISNGNEGDNDRVFSEHYPIQTA
jgi:hypothetical protein